MNDSGFTKYRVMIVEDSSLIRGYLIRALQNDPQIEICGVAENGRIAVDKVKLYNPEIILLDVEMPVMDGITALPLLVKACPEAKIIMISTLTAKNAAISIEAMSKGASDYLEKPSAETDKTLFKTELIQKIKAIALSIRKVEEKYTKDDEFRFLKAENKLQVPPRLNNVSVSVEKTSQEKNNNTISKDENQQTAYVPVLPPASATSAIFTNDDNRFAGFKPDILAIGSSTGGPNVLHEVFKQIGNSIGHIPTFITQHMPPKFTTFLAQSIATTSGMRCTEPQDGQKVEKGWIYIAPGDYHMLVEPKGIDKIIRLTKDAPENFCRPSVDPMLRSLVNAYGKNILTVIMTGMGSDGKLGAKLVHEKGGKVIIQDEASSVVWGMPGAIAKEGFQDGIYSSHDISKQIIKLCRSDL
ncbi:MAG: chemotaxis response regulator protein-glutamate methylesterase [Rickettsiales bacterium]|nr:chemotaxis response regulator protein-glutamate methylesterase [Pseudomonadota bacterium]MDA0966533.1 chemotaxis response regulator protein-glutamate methylesterase [Pseudomonadota bacterium]MDG4543395.1 chemotaxis response regulator protein-glutamate methylesterase [Rickettsiales bacterium]MDG4546637.1 chemotaxis response regulator protein-glutamate methylesterase [Rickettsiales bacterium]MDG4548110.1 chemotaxis response regulator protein-glutamate methylesterase [Rickettsiales bacterium]